MQLYRIAKDTFIKDLTGIGAKTVGGRWNRKGTAILYTSTTAALSTLEVLAHLPPAYFPDDMAMAIIEIPDKEVSVLDTSLLPKEWNQIPPPTTLHEITEDWIENNNSLGLVVPSIIVPREQNVLINPLHPNFSKLKLKEIEAYSFDSRLLK